MKNISVRKANISDLKTIQRLNGELCARENREFDETINAQYPFSKAGEEYFKLKIESSDSLTLVAEVEGIIVGYLAGSIIAPEDYRTLTKMAEAENMFVEESFRGQGVGTKLSEQFEDWCRGKGAQRIRHVASAANSEAIKFYKAHGSKEVSVTLEKEL